MQDLPQDHVAELLREGFTVVRRAVSDATVSDLNHAVETFKSRNQKHWTHAVGSDGLARRIVNLHMAIPSLSAAIANSQKLCHSMQSFFGESPRIYTSLYFEGGSEQSTHRDTPYFTTVPEKKFIGLWLALEDTSTVNGALQVIRRGHLAGEPDRKSIAKRLYGDLDKIPAIDEALWNDYQNAVLKICNEQGLTEEIIPVRAGDAIIWHADLPHGGSLISAPGSSRKSIVFHVTPRNCPVYHMKEFFNQDSPRDQFSSWNEEIVPSNNPDIPTIFLARTSEHVSFAHAADVPLSDLLLSQC